MGASSSLSRWMTILLPRSEPATAASARSAAPVFSGPSSCRSTWLAPAETTRWMRSISGCAASRPSTCRGSSIPEAPETRRARRWGMGAMHPVYAPPRGGAYSGKSRLYTHRPRCTGQEQAAAVEAAQDLAAQGLDGVDLLAVGAEDDVARAEPALGRQRAARPPGGWRGRPRRLDREPHRALQHLEAQALGRMHGLQAPLQRSGSPRRTSSSTAAPAAAV